MPIRQGGMFARRCPTWLRDHFWRRMIAPRWSRPTTWNEFLPMSMPTTAMAVLLRDMGWAPCSCDPPLSAEILRGARPDHPIIGLAVNKPYGPDRQISTHRTGHANDRCHLTVHPCKV